MYTPHASSRSKTVANSEVSSLQVVSIRQQPRAIMSQIQPANLGEAVCKCSYMYITYLSNGDAS